MMKTLQELELIDGRYRLIQELGAGAFGSVHRATQVVLGRNLREVALKLFKAEVINEDNVEKEMNDALAIIELLSQCSDWEIRQHFLTIYDLGLTQESPRRAYIAMELVSEGSLARRLKAPFTVEGTLPYFTQIVRALAFMHENRFVHSDLKPDNILVFRHADRDHIKIGDFGLSGRHSGLFGDGPRGGDMAYIAPEMLEGMAATPAADVFSLGVMLWEMITGRNPYAAAGKTLTEEQREDEALMRQLRREYRRQPLQLQRREFPEIAASSRAAQLGTMLDIINRMLEPDLANRYASAIEVRRDLSVAAGLSDPTENDRTTAACSSSGNTDQDAVQEPVLQQQNQWESLIGLRNWAEAEKVSLALIEARPQLADGWLMWSGTSLKMADSYLSRQDARGAKRMMQYRKQARSRLIDGVAKCTQPDEQRRLQLALAGVFELLGDSASAEQIRRDIS